MNDRRLTWICRGAVATLVLGAAGCSDAGAGPEVLYTPPPTFETLLETSGAGPVTTQTFAAEAAWDMKYTYDCSGQPGGTGAFKVLVRIADQPVNVVADVVGPQGDKVTRWPHGGSYSLQVATECSWTLRVEG